MASILKSFSAENEKFLYEDIKEFSDVGLGQDEVIKYIFILQDLIRISSGLYDFFADQKPSVIPLYFIGYHLFHKKV